MRRFKTVLAGTTGALALAGCTMSGQAPMASASSEAPMPIEAEAATPVALDTLFESYDRASLAMSPVSKSYRGVRDADYGKWDDPSDEAAEADFELLQETAGLMRERYDVSQLPDNDALSYRLFEALADRRASLHPFREYGFLFDHRRGAHTSLPAFLINIHRVSSLEDAEAYVSRIEGIGPLLDELIAQSAARADAGIMPPDWVYPYVISDLEALIDAGDNNAVLNDFDGKIAPLTRDLPPGGGNLCECGHRPFGSGPHGVERFGAPGLSAPSRRNETPAGDGAHRRRRVAAATGRGILRCAAGELHHH